MSSNRRDFIKFVVAGAVAAGCPVDLNMIAEASIAADSKRPVVDSESNTICHEVRDGHQFARPPVSARHELVIVGGGNSGLTAAYRSQDRDWLLLEKESHFGGNAYEMEYHGAIYGTGSAFAESKTATGLAKELGLEPLPIDSWDGTIMHGEFVADTWGDGLDHLPYSAAVREDFKKFKAEMLAIDLEKRKMELDNIPLSKFLHGHSPELRQWWDCYGPSNWGTLSHEASAMVAVGDFQGFASPNREHSYYTWPGGLGALSKKLADTLKPKFGDRMLNDCTIIGVAEQRNEVHVTYIHAGKLKTVAAKAVIMATPKFITSRLVDKMPAAQVEAIRQMAYIPYPVVNLIYDKPVFNKGYDNWCPGNSFTDFIVADWTIRNQPGYTQKYNILTCYTPMRRGDRMKLLTDAGAKQVAEHVLHDMQKLFPGSDVDPLEVHIYRRGHPMFMALPGNWSKVMPHVRKPMDRIFFANTDSEGPVSTTSGAIIAAERTLAEVAKRLSGPSKGSTKPQSKETSADANLASHA